MKIEVFETLNYLIHYPKNYKEGERYPVLLQLHGAGTRGITTEEYAQSPSFGDIIASSGDQMIIVAPHCTLDSWFDKFETLIRFANHFATAPFTDSQRFYLMGGSMGAYTAWQLAMSQPHLFAAMIPICGGGMYWNASRLVNVPVWAFHGANDTTVFPEESKKLVEKLQKKGAEAKLTIYPNNAHDAWTDTYRNPEVFAWLLSHRKKNEKKEEISCQGAKEFA